MKVSYISDLHLEINCLLTIDNVDNSEILVLAGDICKLNSILLRFLENVCSKWEYVIYVFGNHEHYTVHGSSKLKFDKFSNLYIVRNSVEHIQIENIHFVCSTLWTPITVDDIGTYDIQRMKLASFGFENNYNRVCSNFISNLFTENYRKMNNLLINLSANLLECETIIVVTHFPPVVECDSPLFAIQSYFHNDIDDIIKDRKISYYIFGHTHYNTEFKKYEIQFLSNQIGYKDEIDYPVNECKVLTIEL